MTALFADTFYWIAIADSADLAHSNALALTNERGNSQIVTTDEVLTEYVTFLLIRSGFAVARRTALKAC